MENLAKKTFINNAIKGLVLFLGFVVFLFLILGYKINYEDFIYTIHDELEDIYFIPTFIFSYVEMLGSFYIRDKKINNKATHFISIIYSLVISFILYLNVSDFSYLRFSNFIWLLVTIEITYLIFMYKEDDLRKILPNGNIIKINKSQNKKKDNEMLTEAAFLNNLYKKKPRMFSHPFSFIGRIRRFEYCISFLIWLILSSFISAITNPVISLILFLPIFWFIIAQGIKRCHDLGHSGWYQLVPFYELFMLFEEGDPYINKYGHNPK